MRSLACVLQSKSAAWRMVEFSEIRTAFKFITSRTSMLAKPWNV